MSQCYLGNDLLVSFMRYLVIQSSLHSISTKLVELTFIKEKIVKTIGSISKIQSLSFDNPWGEIRFPQFSDYFYITSSLGTETYVGYLKSNNLYSGREVTMIFKTDNLKFSNANTQNLQLKNSEVLTSSINGILKLVYDGDKWVEILRT